MAKDVRLDVVDLTKAVNHDQVPAYYDELVGRFCLAGCDPTPPPRNNIDPIAADYRAAEAVGSKAAWKLFLSEHGTDGGNEFVKRAIVQFQKLAALFPAPRPPVKPSMPVIIPSTNEAWAAYNDKDFVTAARLWRIRAESGDAEAELQFGYMKEFGQGVKKSYSEAVVWYRKSAVQGNPLAQSNSWNDVLPRQGN